MRQVSRERIREIAQASYDTDLVYALEELLARREGYDPKKRLPEFQRRAGTFVWVEWKSGYHGWASAVECTEASIACVKREAKRWYPIGGGEG